MLSSLIQYQTHPQLVSAPFKQLADALVIAYDLPRPSNFRFALELYYCLIELIDDFY